MGKTATITFAEQEYTVHRFNVRELKDMFAALDNGTRQAELPLRVIEIALRRSEPKVESFGDLEPISTEFEPAMRTIMELNGVELKPGNPPTAAAE